MAAGVFGALNKATVNAGNLDVQLGPTARGFVSLLLTSLDGLAARDLRRRMLLTNPGYSLRSRESADRELSGDDRLVDHSIEQLASVGQSEWGQRADSFWRRSRRT